jgi:hypothetical protein
MQLCSVPLHFTLLCKVHRSVAITVAITVVLPSTLISRVYPLHMRTTCVNFCSCVFYSHFIWHIPVPSTLLKKVGWQLECNLLHKRNKILYNTHCICNVGYIYSGWYITLNNVSIKFLTFYNMLLYKGLRNSQKPFLKMQNRGLGYLNAFLSSTCSIIYSLKF